MNKFTSIGIYILLTQTYADELKSHLRVSYYQPIQSSGKAAIIFL